jgi:hypothetical protein
LQRSVTGPSPTFQGSYIAPYVYDTMYIYGLLLNRSIEEDLDYKDGELMVNLSKGMSFNGRFPDVFSLLKHRCSLGQK